MIKHRLSTLCLILACFLSAGSLAGQNTRHFDGRDDTVPGEVTAPYPTLRNIAVEWEIRGDDNLNGRVSVRYRAVGAAEGEEAMPLRRVPGCTWHNRESDGPGMAWKNRHSGSIFDLQPTTRYEIDLQLHDPDGGDARRGITVQTRPVPTASADARIIRAHPGNFQDMAASAEPGYVILLAAGHYGYFAVSRDGEPGRPIVIRADTSARFEFQRTHRGAALFNGISLQDRKHVYLEGLWSSGTIDLFNAEDCVVRRCRVHAPFGIISGYSGNLERKWAPAVAARLRSGSDIPPHSTNCYIADNVVVGMTEWTSEAMAVDGKNMGEGIEITGPGNVICHNRVTGFRDCISTLEGRHAYKQVCIDIYNNDIYTGPDDGIEADFCMGNCRIMRNRMTNCFMGVSSQPSLGGPTYFIRNVMYNITHSAYKFSRRSTGNVALHNTTVKTGDGASCSGMDDSTRSLYWNNIAIGGRGVGVFGSRYSNGSGLAAHFPIADVTTVYDYNGYGTVDMPFRGIIAGREFDSLESLRSNTSEKHGVRVGLDVFAAPVVLPDPALKKWAPPDLRLRPGSAAMDAGIVIPNVNDDYTGAAPDLGAYETGQELPVYGPRP